MLLAASLLTPVMSFRLVIILKIDFSTFNVLAHVSPCRIYSQEFVVAMITVGYVTVVGDGFIDLFNVIFVMKRHDEI